MSRSILLFGSSLIKGIPALIILFQLLFIFESKAAVGDTLIVNCSVGEATYLNWLDNLSVKYKIPVVQAGGSVSVVPLPDGYPYMQTCEDTIRHTFTYFDAQGRQTGKNVFLFIRKNLLPPAIISPFPDTLRLTCTDIVPDRNSVSFETCQLASVTYDEVITKDSLCSYSSKIISTWTARDKCNRQTTYRLVILISPLQSSLFLKKAPDVTVPCGSSTHPSATGRPELLESCELVSLTHQDSIVGSISTNCTTSYFIFRKWTAKGSCSSTSFYTQKITVTNTSALRVLCPSDREIKVYNSTCSANVSLPYPLTQGLCPSGSVYLKINEGNTLRWGNTEEKNVLLPSGFHKITYLITDCEGNSSNCIWFVHVKDFYAPEISCSGDKSAVVPTGECIAPVPLPRPTISTDNCNQTHLYQQNSAVDSSYARVIFSDVLLPFSVAFNEVPTSIQDSATISFDFRLNMSNPLVRLNIRGERNELIGSIPFHASGCNIRRNISFKIAPQVVQNWLSDGKVSFSIQPVGQIFPCDSVDIFTKFDNKSFFTANFSVNRLNPYFYINGVTTYPNTIFDLDRPVPVVQLNPGISQVYYVMRDANGNADTCTFNITTIDDQFPIIQCQPVVKKYSPGDISFPVITTDEVILSLSDNCPIARKELNISRLTCEQTNGNIPLILTVFDQAGNKKTCNTVVSVQKETPKPDYKVNVCGGDTLFLFANPPSQALGNVFQYRWTGPNGFTSTLQNPKIPFSQGIHSGNYTVEVTGTMGCKSSGTVNVFIADLPSRAIIQGAQIYCVGSTINMRSGANPIGTNIKYHWYKGTYPTGNLQAITDLPLYSIVQNQETTLSYYLMVENSGCFSEPSVARNIKVYAQPIAKPLQDSLQLCVGGTLNLGTDVQGEGISYLWTGPEGFNSTLRIPPALSNVTLKNGGNYKLAVSRTGCSTSETFIKVAVSEVPEKPSVISNSPICAGDTLFLQSTFFPGEYTWIRPDRTEVKVSSPTLTIPNASTLFSGDWRLKASFLSCPDVFSEFVPITINAFEKPQVVLPAQEVCVGSPVRLSISNPQSSGTYQWKGPLNFQRSGANVLIDSIQLEQKGKYTVQFVTQKGCQGEAVTELFVKQSVLITSFDLTGDACAGNNATLILKPNLLPLDNGTYTYFWSGPNGFVGRNSQVNLSGLGAAANGNYQLYVTAANNCQSKVANYQIKVGERPPKPTAPVSKDLGLNGCLNNKFILSTSPFSGTGSTSYQWQLPDGRKVETILPELEIEKLSFSDAGDYQVMIRNNGCNSEISAVSKIAVKPLPTLSVSHNSPVCAGSTLRLNASQFDGAIYKWSGPGNFSSNNAGIEITQSQKSTNEGNYSVIMTLNGCTTVPVVIPVTVLPAEVIPTLEPINDVCIDKQSSISLKISPTNYLEGSTYVWYADGNPIDSGKQSLLTIQNLNPYVGKSIVFSVKKKGSSCTSEVNASFPIKITAIPSEKAVVENDFSVCPATSINIKAQSTSLSTGSWRQWRSSDNTIVEIKNASSPVASVEGLRPGETYSFIYSLSNGACSQFSADTLTVSLKVQSESYAGLDVKICEATSFSLNAKEVNQLKGLWTQSALQAAQGVKILSPEKGNSGVSGLQAGNKYTFTWTLNGECGTSSDDVSIVISQKNPFAGVDKSICLKDGKIQLDAEPVNEGSSAHWKTTTPGARFSDNESATSFVFGLTGGSHSFIWEVDEGICGQLSRDTVNINILNPPVLKRDTFKMGFNTSLNTPLSITANKDERLTYNLLNNPFRGEAKINSSGILEYKPNALFKGNELLVYQVCNKDCGCSTGEVYIEIGDDKSCLAPSIITPNGDGVNDVFAIPCLFGYKFPNNKVTIYNRRGDVVFKSQGPYQNDWGGKYAEVALPGGTYFFVVDFGDGEKPQSSFLIIQY